MHQKGNMGAKKANINPTSWAVTGTFEGQKFDGINVVPLTKEEKILFTVTTEDGELRKVDEVAFPAQEQTLENFVQISKWVIGKRLMVLL